MLISVVIPLRACNDQAAFPLATGKLVHGFWHRHWKEMDPLLADRIHPHNDLAGFSLSPLMGLPEPAKKTGFSSDTISIKTGQTAWFRIAVMDEQIAQAVLQKPDGWLCTLPHRLEIGPVTWEVLDQVDDSAAAWNLSTDYEELIIQARIKWKWQMDLLTPTAFSGTYVDFTVPLPELLISSWLKRWNRFSPPGREPLSETLVEAARKNLRLVEYDLHTRPGERSTTGCLGSLTIQAFDLDAETRWQMDLLFRYAFFCGSGHRTAQGMGLTRPLDLVDLAEL